MEMNWIESFGCYFLETDTAIKAKVMERSNLFKSELDRKKFFVGVGVVRHTGRGYMFDYAVESEFDTLEEAKKFAEENIVKLRPGEVMFRYAIERRKSLEEFVTNEWQSVSEIVQKHVEAGRSSYFIQDRMLRTAKAEAKKGKYDLKKVKNRYYIRKSVVENDSDL